MSLVVFDRVSLALGGKPIVDELSLRIAEGERVGLVGPNGSGKSTLLRLIAGEQVPDGGAVRISRGVRVGYLPQDVRLEGGQAVLDFVLASVPGRSEIEESLEEAERVLAQGDEDEETLIQLGGHVAELHEQLADFERIYSKHEAERILGGLGFTQEDLVRDLGELSGGWRMRAVLASLLYQRPDVLLLDEPTNHLDMPSVAWLSGFLQHWKGAFVLISHDREFLDEEIRRVVSFEPEGLRSYAGNYSHYERQRAEERVLLDARAKNLDRRREDLQKFIDRFRYKASKAAQVQSRIKELARMEKVEVHGQHRRATFRFAPCLRAGRTILHTEGLGRSFGDLRVLSDLNLTVERGDRIALVGPNGAGKTTLFRLIAGELEPSEGSFAFGHNTKIGYYAQHHAEVLDPRQTVEEAVLECVKEGGRQRVRDVLGALLFGDDEVEKLVGVLSGGERARVALGRLLVDPGNVLLMDEPTNHLDIESSDLLANALAGYEGTLLFVSHNRAFVRRLATKIWSVKGGGVETYPGTFDDYLHMCRSREVRGSNRGDAEAAGWEGSPEPAELSVGASSAARGTRTKGSRAEEKARKREEARLRAERNKGARPLEKKIAKLEAEIAELEGEQTSCSEALSDPRVYDDAARRDPLLERIQYLTASIEKRTAQWVAAQEELEALEPASAS